MSEGKQQDSPGKEQHETPRIPGNVWPLKKILAVVGAIVGVATLVGGLFIHIGVQTTRLDTKIHEESKQIRELVSGNASKLNVLEERVSHVKANTEKIDRKLDRLLMESKKTKLGE